MALGKTTHRSALTLVEVVVGLLLLATLLVGTMLAFSRHARQIRLGQIRLEAVRAADALLAEWLSQGGQIPVNAEGRVPKHTDFCWKTQPLADTIDRTFDIAAVRLDLYYRKEEVQSVRPDEDRALFEKPLVSVDLVVPLPRS